MCFAENGGTTPQPLAYIVHFPRLSVTLDGTDAMWIEQGGRNALLRLNSGESLVVPANCWNRPQWSNPATTLTVLFGRRQIGLSLVEFNGESDPSPQATKTSLHGALAEAPQSIMQAILTLPPQSAHAAVPLVDTLLRALADALTVPPAVATKSRSASLYESICMYVQEHFQFQLNRDSVGELFKISPNHVSRLFKQEGLVAFNDYVNFVRISRAKYLLKFHHQSLDEVAAACGYTETSYFCRVFKKFTKMTPSSYRCQQTGLMGSGSRSRNK